MPKIYRVSALSQISSEADHVVVVKTKRQTYQVSGKATINGTIESFAPIQFADLSGALSIASYWASVQNMPIVTVVIEKDSARVKGRLNLGLRTILKFGCASTKKARPKPGLLS